jgi:hypothetical protein
VARESRRQRLDDQRERESLVAQLESAKRQHRARPLSGEHGRIVGGAPIGVDNPRAFQPFVFQREPLVHRVGRRRAADVDENRIACGWKPGGNGIRRDARGHAAVGRDSSGGWIRTHQQDDEPCVGHRLQVRLQTPDVMSAPDDDCHDRVRENPVACFRDCLFDEPMAGKAMTVPRQARAEVRDDLGIACRGKPPFLYLDEVPGELIEAMRIVSQEIALDHDIRHRPRTVARHAGAFEDCGREDHKLVRAIPSRQAS